MRGKNETTVLYARSTKLPEDLNGFMRVAQQEVKVNVIGTDKVGEFRTVEAASYLIVHEQDVATFVRNTKRLQMLVKHLQEKHPEALRDAPNLPAPTDVGKATAFLKEE